MRSWLIAHHIQQCIIPVNGVGSACEPLLTWGQFSSSFQAYYVIFPLLGAPVVLATFGGAGGSPGSTRPAPSGTRGPWA